MLVMLNVAACTTCKLRHYSIRGRPCVVSAIVFTSLAVLMLILFAFGDHVTSLGGNLTINGQGGDDIFVFGNRAAEDGSAINLNNLDGNQSYSFGSAAGQSGSVSITVSSGCPGSRRDRQRSASSGSVDAS